MNLLALQAIKNNELRREKVIGIGVIGYGYWGPNLVRNFSLTPGARITAVSDLRAERLNAIKTQFPDALITTDTKELIYSKDVDAVAISTPVSKHFSLALEALRAGKHVLVEKPMTTSVTEATQLIEEADRRGLVLMVDHTFLFTGAVRKIKEIIAGGRMGQLYYYDAVRINLGLFQHDVNVIWDLAVHDLSIMDYLLESKPLAVSATGVSHLENTPEDVAHLTIFFPDNLLAHFHVNWLAPVKIRRTIIGGSSNMILYDDLEPSEKVKVYDKGISVNQPAEGINKLKVGYRTGDMWAPALETTEALRMETCHFLECINQKKRPLTDGFAGLRVVQILEAASESMRLRGKLIELTGLSESLTHDPLHLGSELIDPNDMPGSLN